MPRRLVFVPGYAVLGFAVPVVVLVVGLSAMVAVLGSIPANGVAMASAHAGAAPAPHRLSWSACHDGFECATLELPVDYRSANAQQFEMAVLRRPATDTEHRIGSLVINYGGPGVPGTDTLRSAAASIPRVIRQRFDLVSFDPRGTGRSRPIDCIDDTTFERLLSLDSTPNGPADLPAYYDGSASGVDVVAECVSRVGPWLADVGTRNVARDLDRLRAALGERRLTYLGYSYGTVLGAVYAQEFPANIRAMVLDGAVDLSASAHEQLVRNAQGFEHALGAFLDDCAAKTTCAFYSNGDPRTRLDRLRARFELGLTLPGGGSGRRVGVSEFYVTLLTALYERQSWPVLASALRGAAAEHDGTLIRRVADLYAGRRDNGSYDNSTEAFGVITCDDRRTPRVSFSEYRATFQDLSTRFPFFGPLLADSPIGCDPRLPAPSNANTLGDVRATGTAPILVVGTTNDPATPYPGAIELQQRLAGSRLMTLEGTQHGSYALGIPCIDVAVDRYLVQRRLPPRDTRCMG